MSEGEKQQIVETDDMYCPVCKKKWDQFKCKEKDE